MRYYCTHFNIRYLNRAIALHESMEQNAGDYHLFMFAFDDVSVRALEKLALPHVTVVPYGEFENEELLELKARRSFKEYMWTVTAFIIGHVFEHFNVTACTYIDADIFFFGDPEPVFHEREDFSAIITEHRYHPKYDQTATSGRFCVQFNTFTRSPGSQQILRAWQRSVAEWCYDRQEEGKFGDQMYLDEWPGKYPGVHIATHPGIGVAPWNVLNCRDLSEQDGRVSFLTPSGERSEVIFYHFHGVSLFSARVAELGNFILKKPVTGQLYRPYLEAIRRANRRIVEVAPEAALFTPFDWSWRNLARQVIRIKRGIFHISKY